MAGLNHTLNVGAQSLYATRQGVDTAGHNIANAHVEGFSRQSVNVRSRTPSEIRGVIIGNGAYAESITRSHDRFVEKQLNEANQKFGDARERAELLGGIEQIFNPQLESNLSEQMTTFFNAWQTLSSNPEELSARTHVRESARDMASSFNRIDSTLRRHREDIDQKLMGKLGEISDQLARVADLNTAIVGMEAGQGSSANDLRDERDRIVRSLSEEFDVNYYENEYGMLTVRGPGDTVLVDGKKSSSFKAVRDAENNGLSQIVVVDSEGSSARDVTKKLTGGSINGLLDIRDRLIPRMLQRNNELAKSMHDQVNSIHGQGYGLRDFSETVGRSFFVTSGDPTRFATDLTLSDEVLESTDAIAAASSPRAPGDNVVANEILRLRESQVLSGRNATFAQFYGDMVGELGIETVRAEEVMQAHEIVRNDLVSRREAVAGVSLDEEATNMMRWQANYVASSKLINTIDEMYDTLLSMKR